MHVVGTEDEPARVQAAFRDRGNLRGHVVPGRTQANKLELRDAIAQQIEACAHFNVSTMPANAMPSRLSVVTLT